MPKPPSDPLAKYYDWRTASAGDIARNAVQNFLPSAKTDLVQAVSPLFPSNWRNDREAAAKLAVAIASKAWQSFGVKGDAKERALDQAPLGATAQYFRDRYGSVPGVKQTIATDPAGALFDASALLSIPAGGEGLAGRIPGVAGKVAQATTKGARVASDATNPLWLTGKAVSGTAKIAKKAVQGSVVDRTGNLTAAAQSAVQKAFPKGEVGSAEMADPKFKQTLVDTMQKRGITPDAAREAVLAYHDAPTPRSAISGKAPPPRAAGTAQKLSGQAGEKLGDAATALGGAEAPSETALGEALERAQIRARNDYQSRYKTAFSHDGAFHADFATALPETLTETLAARDLPATPATSRNTPA